MNIMECIFDKFWEFGEYSIIIIKEFLGFFDDIVNEINIFVDLLIYFEDGNGYKVFFVVDNLM